ncbi:MAG: LEA type 2 family protein [Deltaproteobacteria bacterium]|jgi:LEA14-like dessication related protein|nr:LEA type 2 family protein [Deltaproteobacteria bacterium]
MRRTVLAVLALPCVLLASCAYLGQVSPDDIKVKVLDVDVGVPRSGGLPLNFRVLLTNFSGATQKIQAVDYTLKINEEQFLSGNVTTPIVLEQNAQTEVELPLTVNYDSIGKTLKSLVRLSKNRYVLQGNVVVDSLFGNVHVPFRREGEIGPAGLE